MRGKSWRQTHTKGEHGRMVALDKSSWLKGHSQTKESDKRFLLSSPLCLNHVSKETSRRVEWETIKC